MTTRQIWDDEARNDGRYVTQEWGGDGSPEQVQPTIDKIIVNLDGVLFASNAHTILEVGCGPGRLLHRLAERRPDRKFFGYDISPVMLSLGDRNRPGNVVTGLIDGRRFHAEVDMIYTVEMFQHIPDITKWSYVDCIAKSLNPGGVGVIQYVVGDEFAPLNYPTSDESILAAIDEAGLRVRPEFGLSQIHDNWRWVVVSR